MRNLRGKYDLFGTFGVYKHTRLSGTKSNKVPDIIGKIVNLYSIPQYHDILCQKTSKLSTHGGGGEMSMFLVFANI